jgi:hypothetical protein
MVFAVGACLKEKDVTEKPKADIVPGTATERKRSVAVHSMLSIQVILYKGKRI